MPTWTLTFLLLAIFAGILGFSSLAGGAAGIAQILFMMFMVMLLVSSLDRMFHGNNP